MESDGNRLDYFPRNLEDYVIDYGDETDNVQQEVNKINDSSDEDQEHQLPSFLQNDEDNDEQIKKLGLQEQVILLGSRTDVPRLLAAADIYINSSHWEGTPVSVLEAMSAGLPVIATRVGENPYLLEPDAGVLVHPHQPQELAAALVYLLSSEDRCHKLGAVARERVRNYYTPEIWRYNLLKLYSELTPNAVPYLESFSNKPFQVGEV